MNTDSVNTVETPSLRVCESPVCGVEFEQGGIQISPKAYCSDACRMDAYAIRRVAKLYGLSVETLHAALSGANR